MRKKYTHLFFDLDHTLWDFETNSLFAMRNVFHHYNLHKSGIEFQHFFQIYSEINKRLWDEYRAGMLSKSELQQLRFQKTFETFAISEIDPEVMDTLYLEEMPKQTHLMDGALEILEYAKSKNYYMSIITNGFREVQLKKLETTGLESYFKHVFISEDIKAPKPSPEIFTHALKSANAKKTKSLMVGDDLSTDILGAYDFGIDSAWLKNKREKYLNTNGINTYQFKPTYELFSIADLKSII